MSQHWNSTKKEIENWLYHKIHKFTSQENRNPCLEKEDWLNRYLYTEVHEIFFSTFPIELYEWLTKLAKSQGSWKLNSPIVWTPKLVWILETFDNKIAWIIDHWLGRILGVFVTEFVVDTSVSYSEAEKNASKDYEVSMLGHWTLGLRCCCVKGE